ncbi:MAG: hypothetical protein FWG68_02155 [Defluviitaleaceae bacterium]|nr:hypothetical protein [Defluviitaleaceae bacterium]
MVTKDLDTITDIEFVLLLDASKDFGRFGKTDRKCSRCGNDFEHFTNNSSYQTRCKTTDCIEITSRGI